MSVEVEIRELPGGRVGTKHFTFRREQVTEAELREMAAEASALADFFAGDAAVDPVEVDKVAEVLVSASTPEPAESPRGQAERLVRGGLRKVDDA